MVSLKLLSLGDVCELSSSGHWGFHGPYKVRVLGLILAANVFLEASAWWKLESA